MRPWIKYFSRFSIRASFSAAPSLSLSHPLPPPRSKPKTSSKSKNGDHARIPYPPPGLRRLPRRGRRRDDRPLRALLLCLGRGRGEAFCCFRAFSLPRRARGPRCGPGSFDPVARLVGKIVSPGAGGAPCFNPAHALAIAVASAGTVVSTKAKAASSPLRAAAVRSAAQVAGALAAALAAASAFPKALKDSLPAPAVSASSSLKAAFAAEAVLGAILAFVVIWASVGGGSNKGKRVAVGVPLVATVILTVVGSELASHAPAFNPAVAGAWSWRSLTSSPSALSSGLLTHAAAFWAAPLLGALAAGAVWRIVKEDEKSSGGVGRTAGKARASKARSAAKSKRR